MPTKQITMPTRSVTESRTVYVCDTSGCDSRIMRSEATCARCGTFACGHHGSFSDDFGAEGAWLCTACATLGAPHAARIRELRALIDVERRAWREKGKAVRG
jgi:hypothetical protein